MSIDDIEIIASEPTLPEPGRLAPEKLAFGSSFTPRMFTMRFGPDQHWHEPRVVPYGPISLNPAALVLHYAQEVFEGLKAFAWDNGEIALFRPEANAQRFNSSSRRLCIPEIDEVFHVAAIELLVDLERAWVPRAPGSALYIRPNTIATEAALGVRVSRSYLFYVILSPAGPYFGGFDPVKVRVEEEHVRAAIGGLGAAKTGSNYAAGLLPGRLAREAGYNQVLFLDAAEHRYVEELGGMNFFMVRRGRLHTVPLTGSILAGITRESLLTLARDEKLEVVEEPIAIDELVADIHSGAVSEIFASGTAAVVTAIGTLGYQGRDHVVAGGQAGPITRRLQQRLTDIQYGRASDPYGWMRKVPRRSS